MWSYDFPALCSPGLGANCQFWLLLRNGFIAHLSSSDNTKQACKIEWERNSAPVSPLCFCRCPRHPSEQREADPGLRRKDGHRPLDLLSQASGLLQFGSSSPGTGPGRAGPSARAIASVDSAGCSAGQRGLRFPESRGWISWHDSPLTSQIPSPRSFLRSFQSQCETLNEERESKPAFVWAACSVPCPHLNWARSMLSSPCHRGGSNETPGHHVNHGSRTQGQDCSLH